MPTLHPKYYNIITAMNVATTSPGAMHSNLRAHTCIFMRGVITVDTVTGGSCFSIPFGCIVSSLSLLGKF